MNEQRSELADRTLRVFMQYSGCDGETALTDLLADLMHWCDEQGLDFETELNRADEHYTHEIEHPEDVA